MLGLRHHGGVLAKEVTVWAWTHAVPLYREHGVALTLAALAASPWAKLSEPGPPWKARSIPKYSLSTWWWGWWWWWWWCVRPVC